MTNVAFLQTNQLTQAIAAQDRGDLFAAQRFYQAALSEDRENFDALRLLGEVQSRLGLLEEALANYNRALAIQPDSFGTLNNRGIVLERLRRFKEALWTFDKALAFQPDFPEAFNNRGIVLHALRRREEALESYDRAVALKPDFVGALNNRGVLLTELNRLDEAIDSYNRAIEIEPDFAEAFNNRGIALKTLKRFEESLESYDKAIAINPDYAEAHNNRAITLMDLRLHEQALAACELALAIKPDFVDAHKDRGLALTYLGRPQEALACYDRALSLAPDYADALFARAIAALSLGDFASGWAGYERRWDHKGALQRKLSAPFPAWQGEEIQGKRLIVYEEQGLGDVIHFSRYLGLLSQLGANVTFLVGSRLHRLLKPLAATVRIMDELPQGETFDFQCALLSLPLAFGTTLASVPASTPYLSPEAQLLAHWRRRIGHHGFKIGICWEGSPHNDLGRNIPLRCFQPIATIPGVRLISLQKTDADDQLPVLPMGMNVESFGADLDCGTDAFVDTAAAISCLDLIITSDTSVAHLAGALGRPVWMALKHAPEWRWMLERSDSPWYPTMTLYRQEVRGDWDSVFVRIASDVAELCAARGLGSLLAEENSYRAPLTKGG